MPTSRLKRIMPSVAAWAITWMVLVGFAPRAMAGTAAPTTAPASVEYLSAPDSGTASVSGTSTLHAWTVSGTAIWGGIRISGPWTSPPPTFQTVWVTIPVDSLKSTEGSGMDDTMYDALKMKADPSITFVLTHADLKSAPSKDDPQFHYDAVGQLTIAGSARSVDLTLDIDPGKGDALTIATQTPLKMTDFGMKPPTAMMGMIQSGDPVTVKITWQLTKKSP